MRNHLGAAALVRSVHDGLCHMPDHRKGEANIPLPDALLSACAMLSRKAPA